MTNKNIIEIESSKFVNVIEIGIWENLMLFSVQSSMGYVKLLSPNLISTIVLLDTNLPKLEKKIDSFRDLLVSRELTKHSETTVQEKEFALKYSFQMIIWVYRLLLTRQNFYLKLNPLH